MLNDNKYIKTCFWYVVEEMEQQENEGRCSEAQDKATPETAGKEPVYYFNTGDVVNLSEVLADIAHKWEEIAFSLRLSKVARAECGNGSFSLKIKLLNVLEKWIEGQQFNEFPPTLQNLKKALAGPIVQEGVVASKLEEKFKKKVSPQTPLKGLVITAVYKEHDKQLLMKRYTQDPEVPRDSWPPVGTRTFINLALVKSIGEPLKSDYSVRGNADDNLASKEKIEYLEVFGKYVSGSTVLVLGRPGSGKTTLVHKVCKDWAKGEALSAAELVFLISLRMVNSVKNDSSLANILRPYYFKRDCSEKITKDIEEDYGKGVCFIFDGFDEYRCPDEVESVVYALLNKSYLPKAMIIMSSRPAAASANLEKMPSAIRIEVFGFTREQTHEYIDSFPFSKSLCIGGLDIETHRTNLMSYLKSHPRVLDMCYLPVNSAIICFLYENEPKNMPQTQTKIYENFIRLIVLRQLIRSDRSIQLNSLEELSGENAQHFKKLCHLAFNMTTNSQQVISQGTADLDDTFLGIVTIDITARLNGFQNSYTFLHLTLQEFLAAYHISRVPLNEQMTIIDKYSGSIHMLTVWKFYFGLVNFDKGLVSAENILGNVPNWYINRTIFKNQCAYESRQISICRLASSGTFSFFFSRLTTSDLSALAYVMSTTAACHMEATPTATPTLPTTELKFVKCQLDDDKLTALMMELNNEALYHLKYLCIDGGELTSAGLEVLAKRLQHSKLKSLGLLNVKFDLDKMKALFHKPKFPRDLIHVQLSGNHIASCDTVEVLARELSCTYIEELDISANRIGDDGAKALLDELRNNTTLLELNLSGNKIGKDSGKAFAIGQHNTTGERTDHSGCKKLILSYNEINLHSATALSDYLLNNYKHLVRLDFSRNAIGSDGVVDVCLKLLHLPKLEILNMTHNKELYQRSGVYFFALKTLHYASLNLSYNDISPAGAVALAHGIKEIQELKFPILHRNLDLPQDSNYRSRIYPYIDLSRNHIDTHGATLLLKALRPCNNIKMVDLRSNCIAKDPDTKTLKAAFRHPKIDRKIFLSETVLSVTSDN